MGRNAIVTLKDGTKRKFSLMKSINVVAINEMHQIVDAGQFQPSYSWEWVANKILFIHGIKPELVQDYTKFFLKVKNAFYMVKNPYNDAFNATLETYRHPELGSRVIKLGLETPDEVKKDLTVQKETRIENQIHTHNLRGQARNDQIGFNQKKIGLDKDIE